MAHDEKGLAEGWFEAYWGEAWDEAAVNELGSPEMVLDHTIHHPVSGLASAIAFMKGFRDAFPDLAFRIVDGPSPIGIASR